MPPRSKNRKFTAKEELFIKAYAGKPTDAARAAGYANPEKKGAAIANRPHILAELQKKQEKAFDRSAKKLAEKVSVSRSEIINGLHTEAKGADTASARVSAWRELAEIFQLKQKSGKDTDIFAGWNDEELEEYHRTGRLPEWFGLSAEEDHDRTSEGTGLSAGNPPPGVPTGNGHALGSSASPPGTTQAATPAGKPTRRTN